MDSDDDAFDKFIEIVDYDSDKENSVLRTRPEQINLIVAFVKENNEGHGIEKAAFGVMWEHLSKQLNDIGPPKHSVKKWKRVWSVYKYNNRCRLPEILDKENRTRDDDQANLSPNSKKSKTELLCNTSNVSSKTKLCETPNESTKTHISDETLSSVSHQGVHKLITLPGNLMESNTENSSIRTEIASTDMLSLVLQQQKKIIEKLDKHEDILNEIVKKI